MIQPIVDPRPGLLLDGAASPSASAALSELTLEQPLDGPARLEVHLDAFGSLDGREPGIVFGELRVGTRIDVELGLAERAIAFSGEITALEERHGFGRGPERVLLAEDPLHRLALLRANRAYEELSIDDILTRLAQDAGLDADVSVSSRVQTVHQLGESHLALLRRIVRPFDVHARVDDGTLVVRPHEPTAQPVVLDSQDNAHQVVVRVDSARQVASVRVAGYDLAGGQAVAADASALQPPAAGEGAHELLARVGWSADAFAPQPTARSQDEASDLSRGAFSARAARLYTGEVVCAGDPRHAPGREVELEGISARFTGRWVVERAVHRFDLVAGYRCLLRVARAGGEA